MPRDVPIDDRFRRGLARKPARGVVALAAVWMLRQYCRPIASAQNVRTFAWAKT
jgi:hypothetical protein